VKNHVHDLLERLHVGSRSDAVAQLGQPPARGVPLVHPAVKIAYVRNE
jgi:hypothetical protein